MSSVEYGSCGIHVSFGKIHWSVGMSGQKDDKMCQIIVYGKNAQNIIRMKMKNLIFGIQKW